MKQNAITPEIKKMLQDIVTKIPTVRTMTHEKHRMTKEELDELGYVGAEKLADGTYSYPYPVMVAMNHYRHLKKAYQTGGAEACMAYLDKIKKITDAHTASQKQNTDEKVPTKHSSVSLKTIVDKLDLKNFWRRLISFK